MHLTRCLLLDSFHKASLLPSRGWSNRIFQHSFGGRTFYEAAARLQSSSKGVNNVVTDVKGVPYKSSLHDQQEKNTSTRSVPEEADVVVIGGGSIGCSVAYHLSKMGAGKVVLLEKHKLTAGTTWHTNGILWRLSAHSLEMEMIDHTFKLMTEILPEEDRQETGWVQTGGLFTAYTDERMDIYKAMGTMGKYFGIDSYILKPSEVVDLYPRLDISKVIGAIFSPKDGAMDPAGTCIAYTRAAKQYGAQIFEDCAVEGISTKEDSNGVRRVASVETDRGSIKTSSVVNCAGVWAPYVGKMVGISMPQIAMKHAYVVTESIPGIEKTPSVRDHDSSVCLRRQGDTIQIGGYEPNPVTCEKVENDFAFGLYDLDWDVFGHCVEKACELLPAILESGIRSTVCGPESFTPDGNPILGESPRVRGFFFGSGFNSGGMMLGGGAGREIANWVVNGRPSIDMFPWDIRRFPSSLVTNNRWLNEKSHETYAKHYSIAFHYDQPLAGRNARVDPLHQTLQERGCYFEEKHGWERPGYFVPACNKTLPIKDYDFYGCYGNVKHADYPYRDYLEHDHTFAYPGLVHKQIGREALTCRTAACVFDASYMGKLLITGPDASVATRRLFSRDVTGKVRRNPCTYTLMLNEGGGLESDLIVAKMEDKSGASEYYMTVGGETTEYCKGYLSDHLRGSGLRCSVEDRTEEMCLLSVQGPKSRDILHKVLDSGDIQKLKFSHWMSAEVAGLPATLMRISYIGELGYEIHCSSQHVARIYDVIMEETEKAGGCDSGYRAMESLSTEIGFHHWGHSIRGDDSPSESRLLHLCDDGSYVGSEAVRRMRSEDPKKMLVCLTVDDPVQLFGHELIYRNDDVVGYTRNASHAFALDKEIAFGYVELSSSLSTLSDNVLLTGNYAIECRGVKYAATVHPSSPFDPQFSRMMGKYPPGGQDKLALMLRGLG